MSEIREWFHLLKDLSGTFDVWGGDSVPVNVVCREERRGVDFFSSVPGRSTLTGPFPQGGGATEVPTSEVGTATVTRHSFRRHSHRQTIMKREDHGTHFSREREVVRTLKCNNSVGGNDGVRTSFVGANDLTEFLPPTLRQNESGRFGTDWGEGAKGFELVDLTPSKTREWRSGNAFDTGDGPRRDEGRAGDRWRTKSPVAVRVEV